MDLMAWAYTLQKDLLDAGQGRIASFIDRIPDLVHDNKTAQVEALMPEALAAARALKNPWLEIYFRHWEMRNRIGNRAEGESALADAVALLEFAHREENRACPQSVCTTHDIAGCYGNLDGPGWAEERKEVCEETLTRVTPAWPCYICLNREYVFALMDQQRYDEALARLDALEEGLRQCGEPEESRVYNDRAWVAFRQGRYEDALALVEKGSSVDDAITASNGYRVRAALQKSRILAVMGRMDEAWESMPRWADVEPGDYAAWVETAFLLSINDAEANTWSLGRCIQQAVEHLHGAGAHRKCIDAAVCHARLALARGAPWTVWRALAVAEEHLPKLRVPLGADTRLEELRREVQAAKAAVMLPAPAAELPAYLDSRERRDPEQDAGWLTIALTELPDNAELVLQAANAMNACRAYGEAADLLRDFLERNEGAHFNVYFKLLEMYLNAGRDAEAEALTRRFDAKEPGLGHWGRAYFALQRERWSDVLPEAAAALEYLPEAMGPKRFIAIAALRVKDFPLAVSAWQAVIDATGNDEDVSHDRWNLLTAASAAQDWATVRRVAADLDISLEPGSGNPSEAAPVEEDWGWVRLRFFEDGDWLEYYGVRTGPCTARVVSIASPGDVQHVRDWVVFDPAYLEDPPEDEEERKDYIVPHKVLHVLEQAGYTAWLCDGADPGDDELNAFMEFMDAHSVAVRLRQREDYTVADPDDPSGEGELPGIFFAMATPPDMPPARANALLEEATAGWPHPLCWRELARAAGADVARHERVIELYQL